MLQILHVKAQIFTSKVAIQIYIVTHVNFFLFRLWFSSFCPYGFGIFLFSNFILIFSLFSFFTFTFWYLDFLFLTSWVIFFLKWSLNSFIHIFSWRILAWVKLLWLKLLIIQTLRIIWIQTKRFFWLLRNLSDIFRIIFRIKWIKCIEIL